MSIVPESPRDLGLPYVDWRKHQREVIDQIHSSDKRAYFVSALPGYGKSGVAASLAKLTKGRCLIITKTKQLMFQYLQDFPWMKTLVGKEDYNCILPKQEDVPVSQAPCQTGYNCSLQRECPYFMQQRISSSSRVVVTNYAKVSTTPQMNIDLLVCDEGHMLEEQIRSAHTVRLEYQMLADLGLTVKPFGSILEASLWATSKHTMVQRELTQLGTLLRQDPVGSPEARARYFKLKSIERPLFQLSQADPQALWSIEPYRHVMHIKPVWGAKHAHTIFGGAKKIVVQSATLLPGPRMAKMLGLKDYEYIEVPTDFPPERHPIYFWPVAKLDLHSSPAEITKLVKGIDRVLEQYPKQRGIIHTVNMTLTQEIAKRSRYRNRMIVQEPKKRRTEVIDRYLKTAYSVLVSPSVMTGLDGRFEKARFQIIAKMPFENQGDRSVAARLESDPQWYAFQTAFSLQQAAGRVMRDKSDFGETWILDEHFEWWFKQNRGLLSDWFLDSLSRRTL